MELRIERSFGNKTFFNLDSISEEYFILSIMPLKNKNADGSPVRAISIENI